MIDPKRLELDGDDIPHLLTPVVVDPKQVERAALGRARDGGTLQDARLEGVRNIEQHNRNMRALASEQQPGRDGEPPKPLPFVLVVIDELADLMMVAGNEVEESICRLAQMARAVGIH